MHTWPSKRTIIILQALVSPLKVHPQEKMQDAYDRPLRLGLLIVSAPVEQVSVGYLGCLRKVTVVESSRMC